MRSLVRRLKGHDQEGYGLAWSPKIEGVLISGSDDKKVCMWDISAVTGKEADAVATFNGHEMVVEDVQFHCHNQDMSYAPISQAIPPFGGSILLCLIETIISCPT